MIREMKSADSGVLFNLHPPTAAGTETPPFLTYAFKISHTASRRVGKMINKSVFISTLITVCGCYSTRMADRLRFFSYLQKTVMEQHNYWHLTDHV